MTSFEELVASRKDWIEAVLRPWCARASLTDLRKAHAEWSDIAGRAAPEMTLWTWAWSRFPAIVEEGIHGVSETHEVRVTLRDGAVVVGFPNARNSAMGRLVLLVRSATGRYDAESGPHSLDEIAGIDRV